MPGSAKTMAALTVGALVLVTAYTVALGGNGWLWFGWVVLGLLTVAVVATDHTHHGPTHRT
ncbi:hypothetical protein AB0C51_19390 [Streptomyces pathocidini]|uniref:hypothetical protein n=1 Tax=Streptomyces pathocidini TaxID=1650571 RepID=UPI0033FA7FED